MSSCPCPQFDIQKYRDKPYEETPCASCFMTRETNKTNKHSKLYDTDGAEAPPQKPPEVVPVEQLQDISMTPQALATVVAACEQNFLLVLSNTVLKLVSLSKEYPVLFQILTLKMQHPELSYYDIGRRLDPPCSKQNVLYHLSHAVRQIPDLQKAIFTDTRFSGGRYALKKIAQVSAKSAEIDRVRKLIYVENESNRQKTYQQLKQIFLNPSNVSIIDDYDTYLKQSDSITEDKA